MAKKPSAAARARRLIALLGRFEKGARLPIGDLAEEFGATVAEIADDLDTLSMCGVAPYDPGTLVPVIVEDGIVEIWGDLPAGNGGVRLSAGEAAALAAALQAAGFSSDDELTARLLAASSAGFDASELEQTIRTATARHDGAVYEALAVGVKEHRVAEIDYVSGGRTVSTTRTIEPTRLFAERGLWYLSAWCRMAEDWRTFRVDRIRSAAIRTDTFSERPGAPSGVTFETDRLPVATLRFAENEPFIEREWPGARVVREHEGPGTLVEVPYDNTSWIARMVSARLGQVEVQAPTKVRAAVKRYAAARLSEARPEL